MSVSWGLSPPKLLITGLIVDINLISMKVGNLRFTVKFPPTKQETPG